MEHRGHGAAGLPGVSENGQLEVPGTGLGHLESHTSKKLFPPSELTGRYFCLVEVIENFRRKTNPVVFQSKLYATVEYL